MEHRIQGLDVKDMIIGLGETGRPLFNILSEKYDVVGYDPKTGFTGEEPKLVEFLHICIPYSDRFVEIVKEYQFRYNPRITVIHSTVPIGTTAKLNDAVHSPILGKHGNMEKSIRDFTKWIGGEYDQAEDTALYFEDAGLKCKTVGKSEETEALKLICLAKYGMSIAFAQYIQEVADDIGFPYSDVLEWDINYNRNVLPNLRRPLITPPGKKIGGHCVRQNTPHLHAFKENKILEEILKFEV